MIGNGGGFPWIVPVDMVAAARDTLRTDEERAAIAVVLENWETSETLRCRNALTLRLAANDMLDAWLAEADVDLVCDYETRHAWLPTLHDAWQARTTALGSLIMTSLKAQQSAMEEIRARLSPETGERFRLAVFRRALRLWRTNDPPPPDREFDALRSSIDAPAEERNTEPDSLRAAWLTRELALLRRLETAAMSAATPFWPLIGGGWNPEDDVFGETKRAIKALRYARQ